MKRILIASALAIVLFADKAMAQQGFGTNTPDKSSAVDIVSTKRGLLIPRISIPNLAAAAPVTAPATSLLVYNTNVATGAGFYFWDGAKWVVFVSGNTVKSTTVSSPDTKLTVTPTVTGNSTDYSVKLNEANLALNNIGGTLNTNKITPGADRQVLITKMVAGVPTPTFVDASEIINDGILADNGLTKTGNKLQLGGALIQATTIATGANTLAVTGLTDASATYDAATQLVMIMGADGILKKTSSKALVENAISKNNLTAKTLKGDGITVTAGAASGTSTSVANSILADITLGIGDKSVTAAKLSSGAAALGTIATADGAGNVTYTTASASLGKTLTTDGKIIVVGGTTETTNTNAVLVATQLAIKAGTIGTTELTDGAVTSAKILDGTITPADMEKPTGINKVLTTGADGNVAWVDQNSLKNKDNFVGTAPITITAGAANATGGVTNTIAVNTASTALGVVKQAAATPSVMINGAGDLSVNTTNVTVAGDVTGPLSATTVTALRGRNISATAPTANQVLTYDGTNWTPTAPNSLVNVNNGISKEAVTNNIQLGGALIKATTVTADATNTLAVNGLQSAAAANKIVVAENAAGVLRTVVRALAYNAAATFTVNTATIAGYTDYTQEVNISATIPAAGDLDVVLPAASAANIGQVINVKIANTDETTYAGYVNIKVGATVLVYGGMPYQGWVVKSNGTNWIVAGRN